MGIRVQCILLATSLLSAAAQVPNAVPSEPPGAQLLSPDQLDNLVAPVALYPDQLLGEVLAASTYPLEIVEAQQWLQHNGNLQGSQLMSAAKQQNWDPSVQAMVAFPDAMGLLTRDIQWTTALGNAFLAQQSGVMDAIQRMRARAQSNGRLATSPQQVVSSQFQDGQDSIQIQPPNPQVMYVPNYNPQYVWGPPVEGNYPQLGYPSGDSGGFGFGNAVNIASYLAGFAGLLTGGWGWGINWLAHSLFLNGLFFNLFGFHGGGGGGYGGYGLHSAWVHDPVHRLGVAYSDRAVAGRFGGNYRPVNASFGSQSGLNNGWRTASGSGRAFGERSLSERTFTSSFAARPGAAAGGWHTPSGARSFGGQSFASGSRFEGSRSYEAASNRGWNTPSRSSFAAPERSFPQQRYTAQRFSEPRDSSFSAQHFSAPRVSTPRVSAPRYSAPKFSGSHSSGGSHFSEGFHFSGGHGGGGHSGGGHSGGHGGSHRK